MMIVENLQPNAIDEVWTDIVPAAMQLMLWTIELISLSDSNDGEEHFWRGSPV